MFWNSTIYPKRRSFGLLPLPSSRSKDRLCWRTATSSHFWSSTIYTTFHHIHYISQRSNAKNFFWITGYSVKIRNQVQTITRAILPRNQSPSESNSQRGWSCEQIFDSSTTFLNPLVGTNSIYGKRTVGFFFSRLTRPYGCVRLACFARLRLLRLSLPFFFTDFENKTDCCAA